MMVTPRTWANNLKVGCAMHKALQRSWVFAALTLTILLLLNPFSANAEDVNDIQWRKKDGVVVVIGSPYLDVYVQPGRSHDRYHVIEKNQRMRIFKERSGWYKVETEDGKIGWVKKRDLTTVYDVNGYLLDFSVPRWNEAKNPIQFGLTASKINNAYGYTLFAGYRFTPNISTELRYSHGFSDISNVKFATLNLVHQPFPAWRFSPFFTVGAGAFITSPDAVLVTPDDTQDNILNVGGGLIIYLSHKVAARLEYNKHTLLTTRDNNEEVEEWKAGLSVLF